MSTFVTNTFTGLRPNVTVRPHTDTPRRRKALELDDDDLFKHADDDESTRTVKRCKRSEEDVEKASIHQRLEELSINVPGKKRVRDEGKADRLRKRFAKSVRNIPAQPDSEGAQFPFTFTPKPFAPRIDAMEDIEVPFSTIDLDLVSQTKQVTVSPQDSQVPMSIDGAQHVDPVGSIEVSVAITIINTEMEVASEPALALDAATPSLGDEDKVVTGAPQVVIPVDVKSFIPRFLARAAAAAAATTTVPRQAVQLKGAVRGTAKSSSRKIAMAATPYSRSRRPQAATATSRARGSLMVPDNLYCHLATTAEQVPGTATEYMPNTSRVLEPLLSIEEVVTSAVEDAVLSVLAEIREGSPAPADVIDRLALKELLGDFQVSTEVTENEVFYDTFEGVEDEIMGEREFFSLPPSPSPSSPQLFSATSDHLNCDDDGCIACLLLADLAQAPNSPPSLCNMSSKDSSAYASDIDEYSIASAPYNVVADPAIWQFRDSCGLPDLDDDDIVVVVVPVEEMLEVESLPIVADPRLGSLVAHLDKWSCVDSACLPPTASYSNILMFSESEIWYDAMDDVVSPSVSLGDVRMACDASFTDNMDDVLVDHIHYSAPPSPALSAADYLAELDFALPSHPHAAIGDLNISTLLGSPLEPLWASPFLGSITANTPYLGTDTCLPSIMDLDVAATPDGVLIPGLDYTTHTTPARPACSSRLSQDDLALAMLEDAPFMDFLNLNVSRVSTPVPSPVIPGGWRENFESMDDLFI